MNCRFGVQRVSVWPEDRDRLSQTIKLQHRILQMVHERHIGMIRMKQRGRDSVWWPGLDKQIEEFVRNCDICAMSGKSVKPRAAPLQPVEWPEQPWDKLQIDIFGDIQAAPYSHRFITVVHDMHSKWPEIQTSKDVTTETVITFLWTVFVR